MLGAILCMLALGLLTREPTSRWSLLSFAGLYLAGSVVIPAHAAPDLYLSITGTLTLMQVAAYSRLPMRLGIVLALACEVVRLATLLLAYYRIPDFIAHRVAVWQGLNYVAAACLLADWGTHGMARHSRVGDWLRRARAAGRATGARRVAAGRSPVGVDTEALP